MIELNEKICLPDLIGERIFIAPYSFPKEQVFGRLLKMICAADARLNFQEILQQILAREVALSTTLDTGLSIPHVRLEDFDRILAALAVLPSPIQEANGHFIKAVFLFILPIRSEFFPTHLNILSTAVEVLSPTIMDKLARCMTSEQVSRLLAQANENREML